MKVMLHIHNEILINFKENEIMKLAGKFMVLKNILNEWGKLDSVRKLP